jgi:glycosyltransferase involved in cell wall biosynthesis
MSPFDSQPTGDWIAYVSPLPFPWGQAGSRRICGMARSLAEAGYSVVVGAGDPLPIPQINLDEGEKAGSIQYLGLNECVPSSTSVPQKFVQIFWASGARTVAWLDSCKKRPTHVFVYGGSAQYMGKLLPWCRKNLVRLIADVVEWYDPTHMTGGVLGPFNFSAQVALRFLYPKCDGLVVISRLLADYYESKGCAVVRIPPTLDVITSAAADNRTRPRDASHLKLVYAGTPGKKDMLASVIEGVARVDPEGVRVKLFVIGPSVEQVRALLGSCDIPVGIKVLGRVPQSEVVEHVASADFTVLLREPMRFANAGFPTKLVESMAAGTPVISNLTSDIGLYLRDGIEGLVCPAPSVQALANTLKRALLLEPAAIETMRNAARAQAERSFDFRCHVRPMVEFMRRLECAEMSRKYLL